MRRDPTAAGRPSASVIVPFAGSDPELERLLDRLSRIRLRAVDRLIVAHNGPGPPPTTAGVLAARGIRSAGFARNAGARGASEDWLVFVDGDTEPDPGLLDAYFDPLPDSATAVLGGAIIDVAPRVTLVARYTVARSRMSQRNTIDRTGTPYAQTGNCAIRRVAFEQVGGFVETVRTAEDADICLRLAAAGWGIEERPAARVRHPACETLRGLLRQIAWHGSGAAWLDRRCPGEFPPPRPRALGGRLARLVAEGAAAIARGDRDDAAFALLDLAGAGAFELGRMLPNRARRG